MPQLRLDLEEATALADVLEIHASRGKLAPIEAQLYSRACLFLHRYTKRQAKMVIDPLLDRLNREQQKDQDEETRGDYR